MSLFISGLTLCSGMVLAQSGGAYFVVSPNMLSSKIFPTSTYLNNGNIMSFTGRENGFVSCTHADVYDPISNTFSEIKMKYAHDMSATVKLQGGNYLILGGCENNGQAPGYAHAEIFDLSSNSFIDKTDMLMPRMMNAGIQLNNGNVLIVGAWNNIAGATYAEIYDTALDTFTLTGAMNNPRAQAILFPCSDGGAMVIGGVPTYGGPALTSVEYYNPNNNTFYLVSNDLINSDPGWIALPISTRPFSDCKLNNNNYLFMAYRESSPKEFSLMEFNPNTKLISRINTNSVLRDAYTDGGFLDFCLNRNDNMAYLMGVDSGAHPQRICMLTVNLSNGNVFFPQSAHTLPPQEYFSASYTYLPQQKKIMVMGINADTSNYTATNKTYQLLPKLVLNNNDVVNNITELQLYPNPAQHHINITLPQIHEHISVKVLDVMGRLIEQKSYTHTSCLNLSIGHYLSGFYMVHINTEAKQYSARFIKQD